MVDSDRKFLFSVIYLIVLLFTMYFSYTFISSYIQQKREYELFKQSWQYVADTNFETEVEIDEETNEERVINLISTPEQLAGAFLQSSSVQAYDYDIGSITNSTYKLTCNVDLSGKTWTSYNFSGTFDGGSFVVSNLTTNSGFVATLSGTIESLIFANVNINCTNGGTVARTMTAGNIERVSVVSGSVSGSSTIGGIVGSMSGGEIKGCKNSASVQSGVRMGGIVGSSNGGTISNCINYGSVSKSECSTSRYLGGIVGYMSSGTIQKCMNRGDISARHYSTGGAVVYTGGIAGYSKVSISQCANYGTIKSGSNCNGAYAGGVAGKSEGQISHCLNEGTISAEGGEVVSSPNSIEQSGEKLQEKKKEGEKGWFKSKYVQVQCEVWDGYYKMPMGRDYVNLMDERYKGIKKGKITMRTINNCYAGGIVGYGTKDVSSCYNKGDVICPSCTDEKTEIFTLGGYVEKIGDTASCDFVWIYVITYKISVYKNNYSINGNDKVNVNNCYGKTLSRYASSGVEVKVQYATDYYSFQGFTDETWKYKAKAYYKQNSGYGFMIEVTQTTVTNANSSEYSLKTYFVSTTYSGKSDLDSTGQKYSTGLTVKPNDQKCYKWDPSASSLGTYYWDEDSSRGVYLKNLFW